MKKILFFVFILLIGIVFVSCKPDDNGEVLPQENIEETLVDFLDHISLPASTSTSITLPSDLPYEDAYLTWDSSHKLIINTLGTLIMRPDVDTLVTFTAVLRYKEYLKTRTYDVLVLKATAVLPSETDFLNPYGFATLGITNRVSIPEVVVNNEVEFLEALSNKNNKVINITSDLDMGYYYVVNKLEEAGKSQSEINNITNGSYYRKNANEPRLHPDLMASGVGQIIIQNRDSGLMIYSSNGITIKHMTGIIKTSKDIVIRNLHLKDIWEWDEVDHGQYKINDWDYFTVETSDNLWFDHLTLEQAYDGIIDVKSGVKNVTFSYMNLSFVPNEFVNHQIDYLESHRDENPYYNELRTTSHLSKESIATLASAQKKGFNIGNTTDGTGFEETTVTFHHIYAKNLLDRFPRLRKGDIHLYNVISDCRDITNLKGLDYPLVNQAIVTTEDGAVLMENSRFMDISEPIKTHQESDLVERYTGKFKVVNSELIQGESYYKGSSGELGSKWVKSNNNILYTLPFYFRNYQTLPYHYAMVEPEVLGASLIASGYGALTSFSGDWKQIIKALGVINPLPTGNMINAKLIEIPDAIIDSSDGVYTVDNPIIYNFYDGGARLYEGVDYTLTIEQGNIDFSVPGSYSVIYTFQSLVNAWDTVIIVQSVVVYSASEGNKIYAYSASREYDHHMSIEYSVYIASGTIYYYVSDEDLESITNEGLYTQVAITKKNDKLTGIPVNGKHYLYLYTFYDGLTSGLIKVTINNEITEVISTVAQFFQMIQPINVTGRYYILGADFDFSSYNSSTFPVVSAANTFTNVLDGNGHTISGINITRTKGGLFYSMRNAIVRNVNFTNINYTIDDLEYYVDGTLTKSSAGDDAGIISANAYEDCSFENITLRDCVISSAKNYIGSIVGRVREGITIFENIKVYNFLGITTGKYDGGLVGGTEVGNISYINNLYFENCEINQTIATDMIGVVIGRARATAQITNVLVNGFTIRGYKNLGIICGKEDSSVSTLVSNVVALVTILPSVPGSSEYAITQAGYVTGNSTSGGSNMNVSNFYSLAISGFNTSGANANVNVLQTFEYSLPNLIGLIAQWEQSSFINSLFT